MSRPTLYVILSVFLTAHCLLADDLAMRAHNAINDAATHLAAQLGPDGRFTYLSHIDPEVTVDREYNEVRLAGAVYALWQFTSDTQSKSYSPHIIKAARYLEREFLVPQPNFPGAAAIVSITPPDKQGQTPRGKMQAKLGASSLGLIAFLAAHTQDPSSISTERCLSLGRFISALQEPNGKFNSLYYPADPGSEADWDSLLYPGEACLALLVLHELNPQGPWLEKSVKGLRYLAETRSSIPPDQMPVDHWAVIATAKLHDIKPETYSAVASREQLIAHSDKICQRILLDRKMRAGEFDQKGFTTPVAVRLEAITSALTYLPPNSEMAQEIREVLPRGIEFLLQCQVTDGPHKGAFMRRNPHVIKRPIPGSRDQELRIDYTQHALSALILYRRATSISRVSSAPLGRNPLQLDIDPGD